MKSSVFREGKEYIVLMEIGWEELHSMKFKIIYRPAQSDFGVIREKRSPVFKFLPFLKRAEVRFLDMSYYGRVITLSQPDFEDSFTTDIDRCDNTLRSWLNAYNLPLTDSVKSLFETLRAGEVEFRFKFDKKGNMVFNGVHEDEREIL